MQTLNFPAVTLKTTKNHPRPQDRKQAIEWARRLVRRRDWVLLDTETTGTGKSDEVVQIGILSSDGEVLLESFVRPVRRNTIPAEATAVHGITIDMLADAPTMQQLLPKLCEVLKGRTTIIYNAEFDTRLLHQAVGSPCDQLLNTCLTTDCAMKMYSAYAGDWMASKADYKWQKLPGAAHGAIEDCRATLRLIQKMAEARIENNGFFSTVSEFFHFLWQQLDKLRF
jgi:DNA polymerase III subunit epsilon